MAHQVEQLDRQSAPGFAPTKVGVVGASGYSGEELIRLLLSHPYAQLQVVTSRQYAGETIADVFPRYAGLPGADAVHFSDPDPETIARQAQVVFLALPHGVASGFAGPLLEAGCRVIDLSADFRIRDPKVYREYYSEEHPAPELLEHAIYGLPEVYRNDLTKARLVASPGCYPTSVLLPLLPLVREGLVDPDSIVANSLSGVSGAGRKVNAAFLFVECNESIRPYGVPKHRHLSEMEQELAAAAGRPVTIQFTPHLIPINRGIVSTITLAPSPEVVGRDSEVLRQRVSACYRQAYQNEPFIRLLNDKELPDTHHVNGTNRLEIGWRVDPRTGRLIVMSAEDNLLKGAGGQAVQSMNRMCGYPETAGLMF